MDDTLALRSSIISAQSLKLLLKLLPIVIFFIFLLSLFLLVRSVRSFSKRPAQSVLLPLFYLLIRHIILTNLFKLTEPLLNNSNLPLKHHPGERIPVADLHCDAMLWTSSVGRSLLHTTMDPIRGDPIGMVDIPRLIEGGVSLQVFAAVISSPRNMNFKSNRRPRWYEDNITTKAVLEWPMRTWRSELQRALFQFQRLKETAVQSHGKLFIVTHRTQLALQNDNFPPPIAAILAVEGLSLLEGDVNNVNLLYETSVRILGPTHFFDTEVGGSLSGECDCGLTAFGERVMQRMSDLGMIVDLAHASPPLIRDITSLSPVSRPAVLLSHTGVRAVCDHVRNYDDDTLQAVVDAGGLVGIALFEPALCGGDIVRSFVRSVRYVADKFGVEAVALGSDWDGAVLSSVSAADVQVLPEALRTLGGFSEESVRRIMYGNTRAFFEKHLS